MLEFYQQGLDLEGLMDLTEGLIRAAAQALYGEMSLPLGLEAPFERWSIRELFKAKAGLDPWLYPSATSLKHAALAAGLPVHTDSPEWDDLYFQIFLNVLEPQIKAPSFLWGYPSSQAALARLDPEDPSRALRFELYAGGLELANAFDELIEPELQRARFLEEQALRARLGLPIYPLDEALLEALGQMQPTAGIAIGFDRLVMLLCRADHIDEVRMEPW